MPRDDVGILDRGATNLEGVGRNSWHHATDSPFAMLLSFSSSHSDYWTFLIQPYRSALSVQPELRSWQGVTEGLSMIPSQNGS